METQEIQLSEDARLLLGYLNLRGGDYFGHISEHDGKYYVIPRPDFNWDSRIQIVGERVKHPECIRVLVDHGLLVLGEHPIHRPHADFSPFGKSVNLVYSLTEKGKEVGARFLATGD